MIKTFVPVVYWALRRSMRGAALLIAVLVAVGGCSSSALPPAMDMDVATVDYKLGPGDKVNMKVFGDESLSGAYQVDGKGMFSVPLVGNIEASGLTKNELENVLRTKLRRYLNDPRVAVEIDSYRPFYIIGEVQKPGSYSYVNGMTVINAVAIAGGFTYRAKDDAFAIRRSDRSTVEGRQMTQVQPGDVIVVRERFF